MNELTEWVKQFAGNLYANYAWSFDQISDLVVCDLGCGYGYLTAIASGYARHIDGYDVDPEAVGFAARQFEPLVTGKNARFRVYDGRTTSVPNGTYDAVLSFEVIEHVVEPTRYLSECARILRAGGMILLSTPNGLIANKRRDVIRYHSRSHLDEYFPTELEQMLTQAGFAIDSWFSKINKTDEHYRTPMKGSLRRVRTFCSSKLKSNDVSYAVLKRLAQLLYRGGRATPDSWEKYQITPIRPDAIHASNCETILLRGHK